MNEHTAQLKIPSTLEHRSLCDEFLQKALRPFCQFASMYPTIEYVVNEGLNNAFKHGNRFDPTKFITIAVKVHRDLLTVSIEDEGEGFNPALIPPDPRIPENRLKESGRGIFLMHSYARSVTYELGGRRLVLTFRAGENILT